MYNYDICILAHPADAAQAQRLAGSLRAYRLPPRTAPALEGGDYRRILLDCSGEPLGDTGELDECRRLIVLCSPEARSFAPIRDKLLYFENKRGRQSIIAVIVRGEPVEAFPPFFIESKTVRRILPDGSVEGRVETQEPVASDLRADTPRRARALLRYETVRIVASLLGLEPDALERRHAKRARRRVLTAAGLVCAVCLFVCAALLYASSVAKREAALAAAMAAESDRVIARLEQELPSRFAGDEQALECVRQTIDEALALYGAEGG